MKRTQIYLTEKEQQELDKLSAKKNTSKSALVREAVDQYLVKHSAEHKKKVMEKAAGIWKDRDDLPDFDKIRKEGDRIDRFWKDRS